MAFIMFPSICNFPCIKAAVELSFPWKRSTKSASFIFIVTSDSPSPLTTVPFDFKSTNHVSSHSPPITNLKTAFVSETILSVMADSTFLKMLATLELGVSAEVAAAAFSFSWS